MRNTRCDARICALPSVLACHRLLPAPAGHSCVPRSSLPCRRLRFAQWALAALLLWLAPCYVSASIAHVGAEPQRSETLADLLREHAYAAVPRRIAQPTRAQLRRFTEALRALRAYREQADQQSIDRARGLLRSVNYQLVVAPDGYWYLRDRLSARGWGAYAVSRAPRGRLLVAVPRSLDEAYALEAGLALFYETGAQALAVAGAAEPGDYAETVSRHTFFHAFHRMYASEDVLAVRGAALDAAGQRAWMPVGASRLWVNRQLPASLELGRLKSRVGALVVIGKAASGPNPQRDLAPRAYAELQLNRDDAARLVAALETRATMPAPWRAQAVKARLEDWLKADAIPDAIPMTSASGFENKILRPLMRIAGAGYARGKWSRGGDAQLRALHYVVAGIGYGITRLREPNGRQEYVVLHPVNPQAGRARYVFRAGGGADYAVSIPAAAREPQALEYGLKIFRVLGARALASGADVPTFASMPDAGGGDPEGQAFMTIVSRTLPLGSAPAADVLLAFADGTMSRDAATPLAERLVSVVKGTGRSYHFVSAMVDAPASSTSSSEIATLWLSPQSNARAGAGLHAVAAAVRRRQPGAGQPTEAPPRALPPARLAGFDVAPESIGSVH